MSSSRDNSDISSLSDQMNKNDISYFHCSEEGYYFITPVNTITKTTNVMCMSTIASISLLVWHCTLGHPSYQT